MPKMVQVRPKITYGMTFLVLLFVKVMIIPVFLFRCVFSESVKFLEMARLIGIIELINGMKIPIARA